MIVQPSRRASEMMLRTLRGSSLTSLALPAEGVWSFDFSKASLNIECPWRIVVGETVVLGGSDHGEQFGLPAPMDAIAEALKILTGKCIEGVEIDPLTADLCIKLSGQARLDAFNCSSGYEGWNYGDVAGLSVAATGGGKLAVWEK